jgi:phosphotransferase system HPr-like phosphotransfer protein
MKRSLTRVIKEDEFLKLAQEYSQNFLKIYNFLRKEDRPYTRRFYAHLIGESEELESFLDDHCARDNKTWYFFSELVACIRNFAKIAFILKHVLNRYLAYDLNDDEADTFLAAAKKISTFLEETVLSLYEEVANESLRLGIKLPKGTLKKNLFTKIYHQKRLPYTINEEDDLDAEKIVAKIATQYLNVVEKFNYFSWNCGKRNVDDLKDTIPNKVNEERSREIISLIHNLQSTYDHYIRHTPLELQDKRLKRFRGYISMPLHLLSVVNWLSHLYQRHIHTTRYDNASYQISAIVNASDILDIMMNFAMFYASRCLQIGKNLSNDILGKYIEIDTCEVKVPENLGFHLRPATLVARLAAYYGTKLSLVVDGGEYNASSILSITLAGGLIARKGYKTVRFKGDKRVLYDLQLLSKYNYGEDEKGNQTILPPELSHLYT